MSEYRNEKCTTLKEPKVMAGASSPKPAEKRYPRWAPSGPVLPILRLYCSAYVYEKLIGTNI